MARPTFAQEPLPHMHTPHVQKQSCTSRTRYVVQRVSLGPRNVSVCLENAAGCSALLAVVNSLLLRGAITIPSRITNVSDTDLVNSITAYMVRVSGERLATNQPAGQDFILRTQANLADAIAALPTLKESFEVKCKFDSIDSFGLSRELNVFDLCRTTLLHGWVVDPEDEKLFAAVAHQTQNELEDLLISADTEEKNTTGTFDEHATSIAKKDERRPASHRSYLREGRNPRADDSDYSADTDEAERIVRHMNGARNMPLDAREGKLRRSNTDFTPRYSRERIPRSSTGSVSRSNSMPHKSRRSLRSVRESGSDGVGGDAQKKGVFHHVGGAIRSLPFFARSKSPQGPNEDLHENSTSPHPIEAHGDLMRHPSPAVRDGDQSNRTSSLSPAEYAELWLGKHKSNLSPEGLRQLESRLSRGEFAILSQGESFRTILRAQADGRIYGLVSDPKTVGHPQAVFELLSSDHDEPPQYCSGADIYRPSVSSEKKGTQAMSSGSGSGNRGPSKDTKRFEEGSSLDIPSPILPSILRRQNSLNSGQHRGLRRTSSSDSSHRRRHQARERCGLPLNKKSSSAGNSQKLPSAKWFNAPRGGESFRHGGTKPRQSQDSMPSSNLGGGMHSEPTSPGQYKLPSQGFGGARQGESSRSLRGKLSRAFEVLQTTPVRQDFYGERRRDY